jgi:hypothetical protein
MSCDPFIRISFSLGLATAPEVGNLTALTWLRLDANKLTGTVPSQLGALTALKHLQLQDNALSNAIPGSLTKLGETIVFRLDANPNLCLLDAASTAAAEKCTPVSCAYEPCPCEAADCCNASTDACPSAEWSPDAAKNGVACAGLQCEVNSTECCVQNPQCSSLTCNTGTRRSVADRTVCGGATCTQNECCEPTPTCSFTGSVCLQTACGKNGGTRFPTNQPVGAKLFM